MSTRREHSTHTTGAHRAHSVRRSTPAQRSVPYERHLDGLFTYCLSVMCEHDAATAALGEALALAERQSARDRAPADRGLHRPWLYALTRWACLRRLAEQSRAGRGPAAGPELSSAAATQRRRDLAALAWPEAAGTAPEQREALELAVRHGLPAREVAAVLSLTTEAAGDLLTSAACEVERTRAALAVVESGGCATVARLSGDDRLLLGSALRRELVRHVDDCAECRRVAERAMAGVAWPGTAPAGAATLAVLQAPRPAVQAAVRAAQRARCQHSPRFGRNGFPVELKDRAARRDRLRSRAVTTTVVATVVAAPVLALWAAYRGAPLTGEGHGSASVSATEREDRSSRPGPPYEKVGKARPRPGDTPGNTSNVSVQAGGTDAGDRATPGHHPGDLTVDARAAGDGTLITLTATGDVPVSWSASTDAHWLALSRTSGTLQPGQSVSLSAYVRESREPSGPWSARIGIAPAGAVVTVEGHGTGTGGRPPGGGPQDTGDGSQEPPGSEEPTPSPDPDPDPDPTPSGPSPSQEPTSSPDPTPGSATPTPSPS